MINTDPIHMRRVCLSCGPCGHERVGAQWRCENCASLSEDDESGVPKKTESAEQAHRRLVAKPLPAPAQPAAGALEAQAIVDRADDEQRMHGDVAVALADSAARYLAPASSGLAASEAKRRGNGRTPAPMPAVEPGERNDDISRAQPDDDERAQRWVKHMLGGAFTGDWEDRYAAVRVLAALRERAEAAERAAWENLRLLGEREAERDEAVAETEQWKRDTADLRAGLLGPAIDAVNARWRAAERRLAELTEAARDVADDPYEDALLVRKLRAVLDRHAREGAQETPLCLRTGSPAPQQDTTVSGGLCECEHCDLVRSRILRERPPLTPATAPEPPDGALTAAQVVEHVRRDMHAGVMSDDEAIDLVERYAREQGMRRLDAQTKAWEAKLTARDAEIAKLREERDDLRHALDHSTPPAPPEPARVDESALRRAAQFVHGYTEEHMATLRERGYGLLAADLRALRAALAAEPPAQASDAPEGWAKRASSVGETWEHEGGAMAWRARDVWSYDSAACRGVADPDARVATRDEAMRRALGWRPPAGTPTRADNSREVSRHLAAAADAVQERALAVEGRCLLHDDVDYDYATRQWLENTARELRMAERDLRARSMALRAGQAGDGGGA